MMRCGRVGSVVGLVLLSAALRSPAAADDTKAEQFGMLVQTAVSSSEVCPVYRPNDALIVSIGKRMGVTLESVATIHAAPFTKGAEAAVRAAKKIKEAHPRKRELCDRLWALYGNDGAVMRGLIVKR